MHPHREKGEKRNPLLFLAAISAGLRSRNKKHDEDCVLSDGRAAGEGDFVKE